MMLSIWELLSDERIDLQLKVKSVLLFCFLNRDFFCALELFYSAYLYSALY